MQAWRQSVGQVRALLARPASRVHLMGVGGVGMAGLAFHLHQRGLHVSGCDCASPATLDWLRAKGIQVFPGHDPRHVCAPMDWVIFSPAVSPQHAELAMATRLALPVFRRGWVLPALLDGRDSVAVAGTHGKTTTTAMITHLLATSGRDPSFFIGGQWGEECGVAGAGRGPHMVVEADESDGTLVAYEPEVAVITNIEYDHMEHFASREEFLQCFEAFAAQARRTLVYCADDAQAAALGKSIPGSISYGCAAGAQVRAVDVQPQAGGMQFKIAGTGWEAGVFTIKVPGLHNVQNMLAACAVGRLCGLTADEMQAAAATFCPVRRRFEVVYAQAGMTVVSDYAHHPTEIRTVIASAKLRQPRRILAVFQPHRFSRTQALGPDFPEAFAGVDHVILTPVYAASEPPQAGGSAEDLRHWFARKGCPEPRLVASLDEARECALRLLQPGDILLVIGAGDVEKVAREIAGRLPRPT